MTRKILVLLAAVVLVVALGSMAKADTLTYTNNTSFIDGTVYATVTVTQVDSNTITIEFKASSGYEFHNAGVAWSQGSIPLTDDSVTTCTTVGGATCDAVLSAGQMDGFGSFNAGVGGGAGSSSGLQDVVITITDTGGVSISSIGSSFAAQMSPYPATGDGCTFFAGNNFVTQSPGGTCSTTNTPEPGMLTLLGTGLLGIAGLVRRKLFA